MDTLYFTMMKMKLTIILLLVTAVTFCQEDKIFKEQITVEKGIKYGDGTIQLTAPVNQSVTWESILNKPSFFSGSYNDLTDKPPTVELQEALSGLGVLVIPKLKTSEIASLEATEGSLVFDTDLKVLKIGDGTKFKTLITGD